MNGKVLFVDDDLNIRRSIERLFFDDDEIEVTTASGAAEALRMLKLSPADVVVSDQMMPEMDGIRLLKEIRRDFPGTRLMMLTGYGEAMADEIESELGSDMPVFSKPWDIEDLRSSIQKLLVDQQEIVEPPTEPQHSTQGMLAAGLAHEICGPLAFIRSNLEVLNRYGDRVRELIALFERFERQAQHDPEYDELRKELNAVRDDAHIDFILKDQRALIEQSLDGTALITDITAALGALSPSAERGHRSDPEACVERALLIARYEVKGSVEVVREIAAVPAVRCNGTELTQILLNLLINAAESIRTSGRVTVRAFTHDQQVVIEVEDDGCGISPEHRGRIFDPYFTTKNCVTGLGLPLISELVRRNQGLIGVRSESGRGSCFRIELPIADDED
ncbi:MAG: response regulator [Acidobacteriota bacterium]|nr:response regulator [Acidobacteriota bacterium]